MIYLFAARARLVVFRADAFFPARRADLALAEVRRLTVLLIAFFFFSAPPLLRGEEIAPSPTNAARTHTTGGSPSMIARQDLPSSLDP
jgi:hypothetical protein